MFKCNNVKNYNGFDININIHNTDDIFSDIWNNFTVTDEGGIIYEKSDIIESVDSFNGDTVDFINFEKTFDNVVDHSVNFSEAVKTTLLSLVDDINEQYPGIFPKKGIVKVYVKNYLDDCNTREYGDYSEFQEVLWIDICNNEDDHSIAESFEYIIKSLKNGDSEYQF